MESDFALIVFVKNPVPGKVKTRLAEKTGDDLALRIYHRLLSYTKTIVRNLKVDMQVWYSGFIPPEDLWDETGSRKKLQEGADLGERMEHAFRSVFREGYKRAVIIGSDCAELTAEILERAFGELDRTDLVVGPSEDGGYYLLGMKELHTPLFKNKQWSSSIVYDQTLCDIEKANLTLTVLPTLNDVDTYADWERVRDRLQD